jgi:hypothetical protein
MEGIVATLGMMSVVVLALNFLPSFVAAYRSHNQTMAIVVLNLVGIVGWLLFVVPGFILWVVALVWSCTSDVRRRGEVAGEIVRVAEFRVTERASFGSGTDRAADDVIELEEVVRVAEKVDPVNDPEAARAIEFLKRS